MKQKKRKCRIIIGGKERKNSCIAAGLAAIDTNFVG